MTAPQPASDTSSPPTVLLAPDKFKGSLAATGVCEALADGIGRSAPSARILRCPIADGGDGTVDAALEAGFSENVTTVTGPTGRPVRARWAQREQDAVLELAESSGLRALPGGHRDHDRAGTHGLGELILAARDAGARRILVGLGGSAGTDAGTGMLAALGARLRTQGGPRLLTQGGAAIEPGAAGLAQLHTADIDPAITALDGIELVAACDVSNPLLGPDGAAAVYGPQKGLSAERIGAIDAQLAQAARLLDPTGRLREQPGAGAAGGTGFALYALGATFQAGADAVLDLLGFDTVLAQADLVITGEGKVDTQTLQGKGPAEVARRAATAGRPVIAVAGLIDLDQQTLRAAGIGRGYDLFSRAHGLDDAIDRAHELLADIGREIGDHLDGASSALA